jgi:hypothetical protein
VFILVIVLVIVGAVAAMVFAHHAARKRRDALAALAARLGLSFFEEPDRLLAKNLNFLRKLDDGSNRYAYNRMNGNFQGHEVAAFDFHYETYSHTNKGARQTHHHYFSVLILMLPRAFPELLITPEGIFSKLAQALGYGDIDFESAEFSRAFCVRSRDKKFAYDVCHPRMMEYLLAHRYLAMEIEGKVLALAFDGCLKVPDVEYHLHQIVKIRCLMPDYLFTPAQS